LRFIKIEINEIKKVVQDVKEKLSKDMESLKKTPKNPGDNEFLK
jgi:hypothetical protein